MREQNMNINGKPRAPVTKWNEPLWSHMAWFQIYNLPEKGKLWKQYKKKKIVVARIFWERDGWEEMKEGQSGVKGSELFGTPLCMSQTPQNHRAWDCMDAGSSTVTRPHSRKRWLQGRLEERGTYAHLSCKSRTSLQATRLYRGTKEGKETS